MEPLVTNRRCLIWLCVCPDNASSSSRWQKLAHAIFAIIAITGPTCVVAACFTYGWKFASTDMGKSIFTFMFGIGQFIAIYSVLAGIFLLRHKVVTIFDDLAMIYKDSKCLLEVSIGLNSDRIGHTRIRIICPNSDRFGLANFKD